MWRCALRAAPGEPAAQTEHDGPGAPRAPSVVCWLWPWIAAIRRGAWRFPRLIRRETNRAAISSAVFLHAAVGILEPRCVPLGTEILDPAKSRIDQLLAPARFVHQRLNL